MEDAVARIRKRHPGKVPCIVHFKEHKHKFIVAPDITMAELMQYTRRQIKKNQEAEFRATKALFFMCGKKMLQGTMTAGTLDHDINNTGTVDITCLEENVFG